AVERASKVGAFDWHRVGQSHSTAEGGQPVSFQLVRARQLLGDPVNAHNLSHGFKNITSGFRTCSLLTKSSISSQVLRVLGVELGRVIGSWLKRLLGNSDCTSEWIVGHSDKVELNQARKPDPGKLALTACWLEGLPMPNPRL